MEVVSLHFPAVQIFEILEEGVGQVGGNGNFLSVTSSNDSQRMTKISIQNFFGVYAAANWGKHSARGNKCKNNILKLPASQICFSGVFLFLLGTFVCIRKRVKARSKS